MSFIAKKDNGLSFEAGWFLADHENVERKTRQMAQSAATTAPNGGKYIPMGTVWPANNATAEGIVYEPVDVSTGDMPGSVVTCGKVYADRLAVTLAAEAKTALEGKGFVFVDTAPTVERPW